MQIPLAFEKKFDSARLNENFTAFTFCMNNFCSECNDVNCGNTNEMST